MNRPSGGYALLPAEPNEARRSRIQALIERALSEGWRIVQSASGKYSLLAPPLGLEERRLIVAQITRAHCESFRARPDSEDILLLVPSMFYKHYAAMLMDHEPP